MPQPILISLSPNTEADDVRLAARLLLAPWRWSRRAIVRLAEQRLSHLFRGRTVVLMNSGRRALASALEGFGIGSGDEVIVQAFTCLAVPESVTATGARPVYADIDSTTYNLTVESVAARITPRTRAIVVQHTFGIPADIRALRALADRHQVRLIEDCAHALGATVDGALVGTFGDAAVLSFGRDKTLSSVFGGAVVSADTNFLRHCRAAEDTRATPPWWWVAQQLLHPIVMWPVTRWYFTLGFGKALLVAAQRARIVSIAVARGEREGALPVFWRWSYSPALAALLLHQLDKLNRFTARRRVIAQRYAAALDVPFAFEELHEGAWLRVPVRVPDAAVFLRAARRERMLLGDWYTAAVTPCSTEQLARVAQYETGSCPRAEAAARTVVNLPTYPRLTDGQVEKVIDFLKIQMPKSKIQTSS